ncbi:MAG: 50S ribosomal protein L32 [Candidatus Peregrinibacteria bacterium]|nr:50S ribosomal protein L32 [Candidatus Peregrinibacteria bacterium]
MAKHPTTKQKLTRSRVRSRYTTFATNARRKLSNSAPIVTCTQCKQPKVNHRICPTCGYYRGKKVVNKASALDKVTKIKA